MKLFRVSLLVLVAAGSVSEARAQWGLYGSPDPLMLPAMQPAVATSPQWGAGPAVVPSTYQPAVTGYAPPGGQVAGLPAGVGNPPPPMPTSGPYPVAAPGGPALAPPPGGVSGPSILGDPQAAPGGPAPGCASCGGGGGCLAGCGAECPWFVTLYGLGMTRDKANHLYTSAQTNALQNQWDYDHFPWSGGGEITFGHRFGCCNQWGIEATYWTLAELSGEGCTPAGCLYNTPFTMRWVEMQGTVNSTGTGCTTAEEWFDNSPCHQVMRMDDVQNIEINVLRFNLCGGSSGCCGGGGCGSFGGCGSCGCDSPLSVDFLMGFRFFRFRDRLIFQAEHGAYCDDQVTPSPYAGDWITLYDQIANNLWGFQIGCNAQYRLCRCLSVFVAPKVGIFDNHMTLDYNLFAMGQNCYYQGSSPTYKPLDYPIHSCGDGFSVLSQIDIGLNWQVSCHWEATAGFRLLAITGMGLADNQVPFYGNDTLAVANIDKNGSLLLYGAFGGLTYRF
jgi:hypothetical protein